MAEIICCGLSCLDVELTNCQVPATRESVVPFEGFAKRAGGSAPQTAFALRTLNVPVEMVTCIGAADENGRTMRRLCEAICPTTFVTVDDEAETTAVSYLPVFKDGTRGCFVNLGANLRVTAGMFSKALNSARFANLKVLHFGYPHLLPSVKLEALLARIPRRVVISLDINGATDDRDAPDRLAGIGRYVRVIHANYDEASLISGCGDMCGILDYFCFALGVSVALITCGKSGVFCMYDGNLSIHRRAYALSASRIINACGAGDAFCAGVIAHIAASYNDSNDADTLCANVGDLEKLCDAGLSSAALRLDPSLLPDSNKPRTRDLAETFRNVDRIAPEAMFDAAASEIASGNDVNSNSK